VKKVFKSLLGIDRVIDLLVEYKAVLEDLRGHNELLQQQQYKLQQQHVSLHLQHDTILQNTGELDALREILLEMEKKSEDGSCLKSELENAKDIVFGLVSETDMKYLEAIRNLKNVTANDLARILGVKRGTTSAKLSELYQRGLVTKVQRGREVFYSIAEEEEETEELEIKEEEKPKKRKRK